MAYAVDQDIGLPRDLQSESLPLNIRQHEVAREILTDDLKNLLEDIKRCSCPSLNCELSVKMHDNLQQFLQLGQNQSFSRQQRPLRNRQGSVYSVDSSSHVKESFFEETDIVTYASNDVTSWDTEIATDDLKYYVKRGFVLIINNNTFKDKFFPRNGSQEEAGRLEKLFSKLNFKVQCHTDKTKSEMESILKQLATTQVLDSYDCFMCVIMSHGSIKGVHGVDNLPYRLDDIVKLFKGNSCKSMIGKPKLFFIQACRGDDSDKGIYIARGGDNVVSDGHRGGYVVPTDSEILIVYSSADGMVSHREFQSNEGRKEVNSWFISALEDTVTKYAHTEDVLSMMTRVNKSVARCGDSRNGLQMPSLFSTLTKSVFLTNTVSRFS